MVSPMKKKQSESWEQNGLAEERSNLENKNQTTKQQQRNAQGIENI
jgi:hypothetical protein